MSAETIRVAVIGCGAISSVHFEAYQQAVDVEIVACCDSDLSRCQSAAIKFGGKAVQHFEDVLQMPDVDAISICTPHYLHYEMTIAALQAGKHVLCEKPMALNLEQAKQIQCVVAQSQCVYAVCYQNRFNPTSIKARELIDSGTLGAFKHGQMRLAWHRSADYYASSPWKGRWDSEGGGVLINQAIHTIDLFCWLGAIPNKIRGQWMNSLLHRAIEVEDTASAVMTFAGGQTATLFATNCHPYNAVPEIVLAFENGCLSLGEELCIDQVPIETNIPVQTNFQDYWGTGHEQLILSFLAKIRDPQSEQFFLAQTDAIHSLAVVCGVYQSQREQNWVTLPLLAQEGHATSADS